MIALYEGYRFLRSRAPGAPKEIWTTVKPVDSPTVEMLWQCVSERGEIRTFGLSQIAAWPQVISPGDRVGITPPDGRHGTRGRYTSGCRCDSCRHANAAYMRERRRSGGLRAE